MPTSLNDPRPKPKISQAARLISAVEVLIIQNWKSAVIAKVMESLPGT